MSEFRKTIPRHVYGQLNNKVDGTAITSGVIVSVVVDGGDYANGAGTLTHKAGGLWEYLPTAGEADSDSCAIHFTHADAIPDRLVFYATPKRLRDLFDISTSGVSQEVNAVLTAAHGEGDWGTTNLSGGEVVVGSFTDLALSQLEGGGITVVSPLYKDGTISIVQGDDYLQSDGRSLNFISTTINQWPDLTGASVQFKAKQKLEFWHVEGEIVSATGTQHIRVQLNSSQTNKTAGWWDYQVRLVLSNNHQLTIAEGRLQIVDELVD